MEKQDVIKKVVANGRLESHLFLQHTQALFGPLNKKPALKPVWANNKLSFVQAGNSQLISTTVGTPPEGYATNGFVWDRGADEALFVAFISPENPVGIYIDGIHAGDWIEITSATGICSFSKDTGHSAISGIIGLISEGVGIAATLYGHPEVTAFVNLGAKYIQDKLKPTGAAAKKRDAFGVEPGSGLKAREEGGVLVCLPQAGGTFTSGDDDHTGRWIKKPGDRVPENYPPHVYGSFFLRQGDSANNRQQATISGQVYLLAWDWKFEDNAGYYQVFVHVKKGVLPPVIIL
ncbi:hypothetical protein [Compostibacter hankyongensis]|uniref:Uncharacterized protein n=1 Tax=Compostibacter hankyongensis TaxID=1007089 RepID=A0ABP8FKF9_9BACT